MDAAAIYQLSISVGAALIGLIAIVFTLSLFVIQQISNTSIPGLLGEYAADSFSQLIYVLLAVLTVLALSCSLIIPAHHPFLPVALLAFCVVGSLVLLWLLFERVALLCDPSNVIKHIRSRGERELLTLEHLRQAVLDADPTLSQAKLRFDHDEQTIPSALALLRHYNPSLTFRFERGLRQLYTLMRAFASQQQHELFREAAGATTELLRQYLDYHGRNLTMGNSVTYMMGLETGEDRILSNALDVYAATARTAASTKDNEMAKVSVQGLAALALQSVSRPPLNHVHGENATAGLILGTIAETVKHFIVTGHTEGTFASFNFLLPVASMLAKEGFYDTARFTASSISELTQLCIVAKQPILATQGTRSLLRLLLFSVQEATQAGDIPGATLKEIFAVCRMELQASPKGTHHRGFDIGMGHPISRVLSVSEDTLVGIHRLLVNGISKALAERNYELWSRLSRIATDLHDEMPRNLTDLGTLAAGKDQFILYYLDQAAYTVTMQMLFLWKAQTDLVQAQDVVEDEAPTAEEAMRRYQYRRFRDDTKEKIRFLAVYFYSRCQGFQEKGIHSDRVLACYASAVSIASEATLLGVEPVAAEIARMLANSAFAALNEQGFIAVFAVCRFVGGLIETSLIAQTRQDTDTQAVIEATLERVFKRCMELTVLEQEKHKGYRIDDPGALLLRSVHDFVRGDRDLMFEEKSGSFARNVTREMALQYHAELAQKFAHWVTEVRVPPAEEA